jgi:hypothetical protein
MHLDVLKPYLYSYFLSLKKGINWGELSVCKHPKNFKLGLEMALMNNFDEVTEHLCPEFICRVGLINYCGYIVPELVYQFS